MAGNPVLDHLEIVSSAKADLREIRLPRLQEVLGVPAVYVQPMNAAEYDMTKRAFARAPANDEGNPLLMNEDLIPIIIARARRQDGRLIFQGPEMKFAAPLLAGLRGWMASCIEALGQEMVIDAPRLEAVAENFSETPAGSGSSEPADS